VPKQNALTLTTIGRNASKRCNVTLWIPPDGNSVFVRSVRSFMVRLATKADGTWRTLQLGGQSIKVKARALTIWLGHINRLSAWNQGWAPMLPVSACYLKLPLAEAGIAS
jgi:hypothetical protein